MPTIIIIDQMHPSILPELKLLGYKVDYEPDITREQLIGVVHNYHGLIVRSKTSIDQKLLEGADLLQFVARAGAGVDNLEEDYISNRGVQIINAPEGNRDSLGEHVIGLLLNLMHKISSANHSIKKNMWDREAFRGTELGGKNVGIIGCGNMGEAFAKRLSSFGCNVYAYDKYKPVEKSKLYERVSIEKLHKNCDILSLHVPLTKETKGFYDYSFFQHFERSLVVLNTARGEVLPLDDLVRLLRERKVEAAGLDVFEQEPFKQLPGNQNDTFEYLINSPHVLLTPHVAGWSIESYERINSVLVTKIAGLRAQGLID